jgi:hypothetical protein
MIVIYARRDAVDAMASSRTLCARTNGAEAYGEVVWSRRPIVGVKSCRNICVAMVTKKPGRQGEHEGNRKTIVQGMPVEPGEPVALPGHFLPKPRVHRTPGIPCALYFLGRTTLQTSDARCRENE